ncbi:hypothetical protein K435DRAFT_963406 [Dendrothele bispora CBS 962.96]|uniref:Uncharacterized protein n=1 Tax=Dendrothele bispora (strain CBS 962.96) TaxID=1314807 RepID=A0A4S8MGV6_DENBC|nr:hypothetical protein K435DRAFT_963406 [Dendrothele bispora CBS 962.96]
MNLLQAPPPSINDVPIELLQRILLEVIPYVNCFPSPPYCHDSPVSLLGVCRRWRDIIVATPMLWTKLLIRTSDSESPQKLLSGDNIRTWVERSKPYPLKIIIYSRLYSLQLQSGTQHLMTHASRNLGNIFFFYQNDEGSEDFYASLQRVDELPRLTEASIFVKGPCASEWWGSLVHQAPNLHSLTWSAFPGYLQWSRLSRITRLELLWPISSEQALYILTCLNDLVELGIRLYNDARFITYIPSLPSASQKHLIHNLRILRLYPISNSEDIAAFVDLVTLPSLTTLEVAMTVEHHSIEWPQTHILSFLDRSSCVLSRLDLFRLDITEEQTIELLRHDSMSQTLVELVISRLDGDEDLTIAGDNLFKLLTIPKSESSDDVTPVILPRLNTVAFAFTMGKATDGALSDMVQSRYPIPRNGAAPLEHLFAVKHGLSFEESSKDAEGLLAMHNAGLDVVLQGDCEWYSTEEKMSSNIKRILENIFA